MKPIVSSKIFLKFWIYQITVTFALFCCSKCFGKVDYLQHLLYWLPLWDELGLTFYVLLTTKSWIMDELKRRIKIAASISQSSKVPLLIILVIKLNLRHCNVFMSSFKAEFKTAASLRLKSVCAECCSY